MLKAELDKNRKLGMEFELFLPRLGNATGNDVQNTLAQILSSNGLPAVARGYSSSPIPSGYSLAVEYDSSIQGTWVWNNVPFAPIEVKTKILAGYEEWESVVPKFLSIAQDLGGKVNQSCGLHLHLSFTEGFHHPRNIASLYNLFYRWEPLVYSVLAPSRTGNPYCLPISEGKGFVQHCRSFDDFKRRLGSRNRKHGLNLLPLFTAHPHIEFRYHQGTLNESKARGWLLFCLQMAQHAINRNIRPLDPLPKSRTNLEKLLVACGFKSNNNVYAEVCPEIRSAGKWLLERYYDFNGRISLRQEKAQKNDPFPSLESP